MNRSGKVNELAHEVSPDVEVASLDALLDWLDLDGLREQRN